MLHGIELHHKKNGSWAIYQLPFLQLYRSQAAMLTEGQTLHCWKFSSLPKTGTNAPACVSAGTGRSDICQFRSRNGL